MLQAILAKGRPPRAEGATGVDRFAVGLASRDPSAAEHGRRGRT